MPRKQVDQTVQACAAHLRAVKAEAGLWRAEHEARGQQMLMSLSVMLDPVVAAPAARGAIAKYNLLQVRPDAAPLRSHLHPLVRRTTHDVPRAPSAARLIHLRDRACPWDLITGLSARITMHAAVICVHSEHFSHGNVQIGRYLSQTDC